MVFGLYTAKYENTEQIYHAELGRDFYNVAAGADGAGMDDANYVHDEVLVKLWRRIDKFFWSDGFDGTVYHIHYYPIRDVYCGNIYI